MHYTHKESVMDQVDCVVSGYSMTSTKMGTQTDITLIKSQSILTQYLGKVVSVIGRICVIGDTKDGSVARLPHGP